MKRTTAKKGLLLALSTVALAASSCSKKDSSDESAASSKADLATLSNPAQLGISTALTVEVPDAYNPSAASLALASGKKSQEACQMGDPIRSVVRSLSDIKSLFCHVEIEKEKIKFGVKTAINAGGQEFLRIWIDNSKVADGKITVYTCKEGKLEQKIDITGVIMGTDGKPTGMKGTVQDQGSEGTQSWARSIVFDKGFTGKYLEISSDDKFSDSSNSGSFARSVQMKLQDVDTEVSKVAMSSKGTWEGQTFSQKGLGLGSSGYGQAIFFNKGSYNGQDFEWTRRSSFDDNGYVVASTASTLLGEGGALYVNKADIPDYLADDFAPEAPTGWDCASVDTTVELDPESTDHQACDAGKDDGEGANCWGEDFENGSAEQ